MKGQGRTSIAARIVDCATQRPRAVAVEDAVETLTYAELVAEAAGVAGTLQQAGIGAEDVVAVALPRSARAVVAMLGVWYAGAAYLPLDPDDPPRRRRALVEVTGASGVIDAETRLGAADGALAHEGGDRLAYVLFTSGSTGLPKGVEITHANLEVLLDCGTDGLPVAQDVVLHACPLTFDIMVSEVWAALTVGARLVIAPHGRPDPAALGRLIADRGVTFISPGAGVLRRLVEDALDDLRGLRVATSGGDVLQPSVGTTLLGAHPHVRLFNLYGPTETTVLATAHEVQAGEIGPIPIGAPLLGYPMAVRDESGRPAETGELWIGGGAVSRGYRGEPDRTAERFVDGWYRTGDRVRLRPDGEFDFLGRLDRQLKIGGMRIEPGEVEHALAAHAAVRAASVVAREDVPGHPRLVAYAAGEPGMLTEAELAEHLAARLPRALVPRTIVVLEALPLTERGKVDRAALPEPAAVAPPGADAPAEAARIADVMARMLQRDELGPDEDFFTAGGDSLLAIGLVGRLRLEFGAAVGIATVFDAPTPRLLAARLEEEGLLMPPLISGPPEREAPATFSQRRGWWFEKVHPGSLAFQSSNLLRLRGELDTTALRKAMGDQLDRHESMRSAFVERDGEPIQVIHNDVELPLEEVDLRGRPSLAWAQLVRERVRRRIDAKRAPLVRWTLARLDDRDWVLLWHEHHFCHDGWSFAYAADELAALYAHHLEGAAAPPAPTAQVRDFARWERELLASPVAERQLDYWRATLDPAPELLALPTDTPRPPRERYDGDVVRSGVAPDLYRELHELTRAEGVTMFMVALAAFACQLARYAGREDVQIGSGIANRIDPATERLVGMLVNTVVLRIDLSGNPTVRELLQRVRRVTIDALAAGQVPFDQVVDALSPPRQADRSPLFQTLFSFHDAPRGATAWPGLEARVTSVVPDGTTKADLNVIGVDERDGRLTFVWEHSTMFSRATAARMADHHVALLEHFATRLDARIGELDLLPAQERDGIEAVARTAARHDREATISGLVLECARRCPDAIAVSDGATQLTYEALARRSATVAAALRERGIGQGDRVAVLLGRSTEAIVSWLGILRAGGAYVPLDPEDPGLRLAQILHGAGTSLVIASPDLASRLPDDIATVSCPDGEAEPWVEPGPRAEDLAYVMFTSGSTGEPKGVAVTHRNVVRLVQDCGYVDLGAGAVVLHAASPAFDAATFEVWGPLVNGGTVSVLGERAQPDAVATAIRRERVTTLWLTAGLFHALLDHHPDALSGVRHVLAGGDVLSPRHVALALGKLAPGSRLTNGYGPTEGTTFSTVHTLCPGDAVPSPVPIGRPVPGTSCHVLDADGREVPFGVAGELWIGGDGVARGYWRDDELTAERFVDGRYRTGDRVRRRPDGVLEFLGRMDRQVKVRGTRVEPAEIEVVLRAHPGVADAAVVARDDGPGGRRLVAYLTSAAEGGVAPAALRVFASERLPEAMVPAAWVTLDALPLSRSGKVDRDALPAPTRAHLALARSPAAARDALERAVVSAFEEALDLSPVTPEDDFFALGGHSLQALGLCAILERELRCEVPAATIFEAPTPRALADHLRVTRPASGSQSLIALRTEGTRPPLFCISAGDGNVLGFAALARRLPEDQPVYALQAPGVGGSGQFDTRIADYARRYLEDILSVAPTGPYLIVGRCNGSAVAHEIALLLEGRGDRVRLLVSLDSSAPHGGPRTLAPGIARDEFVDVAVGASRLAGHEPPPAGDGQLVAWLREPVAPGVSRYLQAAWQIRADLRAAFPQALGDDAAGLSAWGWTSGVQEGLAAPLLLGEPPANGHAVPAAMPKIDAGDAPGAPNGRIASLHEAAARAAREARNDYRAAAWPGGIVNVRSTTFSADPRYGAAWWSAVKAVDEVWMDVAHERMLREPEVAGLARLIEEAIENALAGGADPSELVARAAKPAAWG